MKRSIPPLNPLRTFEVAARMNSFTLAAKELAVSQSAVSHQIKTLEAFFGVPLFDRDRGKISLTAAGKQLFHASEDIFSRLARISNDLPNSDMRDTITVMSPSLASQHWLLSKLDQFNEVYPNIRFQITLTNSQTAPRPADTDVLLFWGQRLPEGFFGSKLFDVYWAPVVASHLADKLPEKFNVGVLDTIRLLHTVDHGGWQGWAESRGLSSSSFTTGWVFSDSLQTLDATIQGRGMCLAPLPLLERQLSAKSLVRVFNHTVETSNKYFLAVSRTALNKSSVLTLRRWFDTTFSVPMFDPEGEEQSSIQERYAGAPRDASSPDLHS